MSRTPLYAGTAALLTALALALALGQAPRAQSDQAPRAQSDDVSAPLPQSSPLGMPLGTSPEAAGAPDAEGPLVGRDVIVETTPPGGDALDRHPIHADDLAGMTVNLLGNEDFGEVTGVILETRSGRIEALVVNAGGALGLGERPFEIPWDRVRAVDPNAETVWVDMTAEDIQSAPTLAIRRQTQGR